MPSPLMMSAKPEATAESLPRSRATCRRSTGAVEWLELAAADRRRSRASRARSWWSIDFWTYSCINCLRAIPYVRAWAKKYKSEGLVVIGVHAPEFAFERDIGNVKKAIADLKITYPVAIDNNYAIWRAFENEFWPAHYFIDAEGRIRYHHFGEGEYEQSEKVIQQLLAEAGSIRSPSGGYVAVNGKRRRARCRRFRCRLARDLYRL